MPVSFYQGGSFLLFLSHRNDKPGGFVIYEKPEVSHKTNAAYDLRFPERE